MHLGCASGILDHISDGHHDVHHNTANHENQDIHRAAAVLNKNKDKISCINVSRHLKHYVKECSDEIFELLEVPHRINCVISRMQLKLTQRKTTKVLDRFSGHEIQLRAN